MLCLACRYPLDQIATPVCPECGLRFNPRDPDTFAPDAAPPAWRLISAAFLACAAAPLIALASAGLSWLLAALTLGRPPIPGTDSPSAIAAAMLPRIIWWLALLATFILIPLLPRLMVAVAVIPWARPHTGARLIAAGLLFYLGGIVALGVLRNTPLIQWAFS